MTKPAIKLSLKDKLTQKPLRENIPVLQRKVTRELHQLLLLRFKMPLYQNH